jgi:hypothetical protein
MRLKTRSVGEADCSDVAASIRAAQKRIDLGFIKYVSIEHEVKHDYQSIPYERSRADTYRS